jgi:hypothetical protein
MPAEWREVRGEARGPTKVNGEADPKGPENVVNGEGTGDHGSEDEPHPNGVERAGG